MNIRTTIARLVMTFDISFPESESKGVQVDPLDNAKDHFSMGIDSMVVRLVRREKKKGG